MLSWPNGKRKIGFRVYLGLLNVAELKRGRQATLRRRNRAREADALQREVAQVELTCVEPGCHPRYHDNYWDMNDDHAAPSAEVWRALVENDEGLRFVDFDGAYRTETGR